MPSLEEEVRNSTWRFLQDFILIMKKARYGNSKRHCVDLNSLSEHGLEDLLNKVKAKSRQSQGDHTLFIKHFLDGKLILLLAYVDDMIIISDDKIAKLTLKEKLATQFEMKELGKLKYLFKIEVAYSKQDIFISQRKYVHDLLKEIGKLGWNTSGVPIEHNHRIECEESPTIEKSQY
ncbi:hypothetical protein CR513_62128, partial [Mucuna pruriens]